MDVIVERNESEANVGLRGRSDGRVKRVVAVQAGLVSKRAYAIRPYDRTIRATTRVCPYAAKKQFTIHHSPFTIHLHPTSYGIKKEISQ